MASSKGENGSWLRRFHRLDADLPRLVCFPHGGGSANAYFPLSAALRPKAEVCAIQYPGRQDRCAEEPIQDMATMADRAFDSLRPWLTDRTVFFGHSMGAVLAFEVARRMEQGTGTTPARLIASGERAPSRVRDDGAHLLDDDALIAEMCRLGGLDPGLLGNADLLAMILPVVRSDYRTIETYQAAPGARLRCPVSAFVGDRDPTVTLDEARSWAEHTTAGFELNVFSGGHFYLNNWPATVIESLSAILAAAGEPVSGSDKEMDS